MIITNQQQYTNTGTASKICDTAVITADSFFFKKNIDGVVKNSVRRKIDPARDSFLVELDTMSMGSLENIAAQSRSGNYDTTAPIIIQYRIQNKEYTYSISDHGHYRAYVDGIQQFMKGLFYCLSE